MTKIPFRDKSPIRSKNVTPKNRYGEYKSELRKDFNERCGYTHTSDKWFGGSRTFHIDHFKPKVDYPELETTYSNLIYCCSYVNGKKSRDINPYLEPCTDDFNHHFYRDSHGNIVSEPTSKIACYMHKKLGLGLRRYGFAWQLEQLESIISKLSATYEAKLKTGTFSSQQELELLRLLQQLNSNYHEYQSYLWQNS